MEKDICPEGLDKTEKMFVGLFLIGTILWSFIAAVLLIGFLFSRQWTAAIIIFVLGAGPLLLILPFFMPQNRSGPEAFEQLNPFFQSKMQQYEIRDYHHTTAWCQDCNFQYEQYSINLQGIKDYLHATPGWKEVQLEEGQCQGASKWWIPLDQRKVKVYRFDPPEGDQHFLIYDPALKLAQGCMEVIY